MIWIGVTPLGRGSGGLGGHRGDSTMRARAVAYRSINQGLALSALSECSSLFVPIHAESLHYAAEGKYKKRRRASIAYMESTCSLTFLLPPPLLTNLFHCSWSRISSILKQPKTNLFLTQSNIYFEHLFTTHSIYCFL